MHFQRNDGIPFNKSICCLLILYIHAGTVQEITSNTLPTQTKVTVESHKPYLSAAFHLDKHDLLQLSFGWYSYGMITDKAVVSISCALSCILYHCVVSVHNSFYDGICVTVCMLSLLHVLGVNYISHLDLPSFLSADTQGLLLTFTYCILLNDSYVICDRICENQSKSHRN